MIYLYTHTDPQEVAVPKNQDGIGVLSLSLTSTVTHEAVQDIVTGLDYEGGHYYHLRVTLPEGVEPAEYEYALVQGLDIVAKGLAMVVPLGDQAEAYDKEITYKQYNTYEQQQDEPLR